MNEKQNRRKGQKKIIKYDCDVVIVGAGPAGSTAGFYLRKLKTIIIDRQDFPRDKACGGGLLSNKDWPREFENYKKIEKKLEKYPNKSIKVYQNGEEVANRKTQHLFDQVSRFNFDNLLLEEALAKKNISFLKFNLRKIKKTKESKRKYKLSDGLKSIYTDYIVGADGVYSLVAKSLGNKILKTNQRGICLVHNLICKKKTKKVHISWGHNQEIGYGWVFPTKEGYSVGVGVVGKSRRGLKKDIKIFLKWAINKKVIPHKFHIKNKFGGVIPLKVAKKYCTENIFLCGDAMGLVRIPTGEGIYYAMKSGKVIGQLLSGGLDNKGLEKEYKKRMRSIIKAVYLVPYIPPRLITLTGLKGILKTMKLFDSIGGLKKINTAYLKKIIRRIKVNRGSFYYKEKIIKQ